MKRKLLLMFISAILIASVLLAATSCDEYPKDVREIPSGFVLLPKGGYWSDGLYYVIWESQISFLDIYENCIYQTGLDDSGFIVEYKNEYYVNEEKILELLDIVTQV